MEAVLQTAFRLGSRVIVTSRNSTPSSLLECFSNIDLSSMSRRDAIATLAEFGISGVDGEEAAEELGDHPLALMVFARYVVAGNRTAAEALHTLRNAKAEKIASNHSGGQSMRATLAASMRTLTTDAKRLLRILCKAHVDGDSPVTGLIRHLESASPNSILELARASLIQVDNLDNPTTSSIHPLVRQFVSENDPDELDDSGRSVGKPS